MGIAKLSGEDDMEEKIRTINWAGGEFLPVLEQLHETGTCDEQVLRPVYT